MGIFRRRQKAAPLVTTTSAFIEIIRALDGTPGSYGNVYRTMAPVRTVVDFLADSVATTSLKVYRRALHGRPEERDHPLAEILRHPNPEMTSRALVGGGVRDVAIYGNAYWRKIELGSQRWLIPIPPFRVIPKGGDLLSPTVYDIWMPNGRPVLTIPREQMVHIKLYNPEEPRIGSSKLDALRSILKEEMEVSRHLGNFWENAAQIAGVIERPLEAGAFEDEEYKRFKADWKEAHSGSRNAGTTAILEDGMKYNPTMFSAKDSQMLESRQFVLEATARVYNVPLSLLGLTETATFASQKEFHKALYQDTLPPWYSLLESEIMRQVLSWFEDPEESDVYAEFNVESKLRGSFEEQAEFLSKLIGRPIMVAREGRDRLNLDDRHDPTDEWMAVPAGANLIIQPPGESPPALTAPEPAALPSGQ